MCSGDTQRLLLLSFGLRAAVRRTCQLCQLLVVQPLAIAMAEVVEL